VTVASGPVIDDRFASDVSRALRLAAVSRAKRGVDVTLCNEGCVAVGVGVSILSGKIFWYVLPRAVDLELFATGCFMNFVSDSFEVGKSSKPSSSWPSPKCFLFFGLLRRSQVSSATLYL
jgi:hypothetical protein